LLRLYLGWIYGARSPVKGNYLYEESGWYDGQTWTKPEEVLQRDRLIVTYQIQPILQRLKRTFGLLVLVFLSGSFVWSFL
ncbi:MAG: CGLD27 family protein, partial [Leptolyngbyaceae cyanobacterium SM1_4_3]|nr:CGLD27 family protein [Leptolyngbyaceae cyanobacterium SM1_4_3]